MESKGVGLSEGGEVVEELLRSKSSASAEVTVGKEERTHAKLAVEDVGEAAVTDSRRLLFLPRRHLNRIVPSLSKVVMHVLRRLFERVPRVTLRFQVGGRERECVRIDRRKGSRIKRLGASWSGGKVAGGVRVS